VRVTDSASNTFDKVFAITILDVNDAPTFTKGANITAPETGVTNTITSWATNFSVGPANESAQTFQFTLTNDNNAVFSVQPAIATNGTLTFKPANNIDTNTLVTVTVVMQDSGGTANGGVNSSSQTFTLTLTVVADTLVVKNTSDSGANSLRDCLTRSRTGDTISFDATVFSLTNSNAATVINVQSELPPLSHNGVTIEAQDRRVTLNGSGAPSANGLVITGNSNVVHGLTIVGFSNSGILIKNGAKSNVIGGNRSTGVGPNGQGLRISNNGSAGVYISGLGTDSNLVKGCWIGLTASGKAALPNLTGVLIDGGAKYNVIGSATSGERNSISGNYFEGITISDIGTDENIISGNILGAAAKTDDDNETSDSQTISRAEETLTIVNRQAVGNGSSGIFLSNGTKSTRVGGETNSEGNLIAYSGDSGIEVRALASKRNTAKANIISRNGRGGIKLYDGSNENVGSPNFSRVTVGPSAAASTQGVNARATHIQYAVEGTVVGDGVVELYSDTGSQGGTILGRTTTAGGKWTASVNLPTGEHLTATFTDANGNTSPFSVFSGINDPTPKLDTDGDGVPDAEELLAGTDPNNSSDAPIMSESIDCGQFSLKLDFKKKIGCIKASLGLVLPKEFQTNGATVALSCGAYSTGLLTLDTKGASPKAATSLKLSASKQGKLSTSKLTLTLKDATLIAALDTLGFTNASTTKKGETVSLPMTLVLHSGTSITVYTLSVDVNYTATINVSGSGKKSGGAGSK
jgi:hypothetical protein